MQQKPLKLTLLFFLLTGISALAQDDIIYQNQIWLGTSTQTKLTNKFAISADAHFVPESFFIIRGGGNYALISNKKSKLNISAGYAHLWLQNPENLKLQRNEHRPWAMLAHSLEVGKNIINNSMRLEGRFREKIASNVIVDGFVYNTRTRNTFQIKHTLHKFPNKRSLYIYGSEDIFFEFGKNVVNKFRFNQNRLSAGFGVVSGKNTYQLGYLNMLKKSPVNTQLTDAHTAMFIYSRVFDLRKK